MVAWLTVKAVAICLGLTTTAFCIATIVLAVENANLESDLQDAMDKLEVALASTTTTPSPSGGTSPGGDITPSGGTSPGGDITPSGGTSPGGDITTPSGGTSPGGEITTSSGSTAPGSTPIYPTLPTGLPKPEDIVYRLPNEVRPIRYRLYYHPNLKTGTFEGDVSIQIQAEAATNLIVLHAKDITIHGISILNMMARMRIAIDKYYLDEVRELLIIELKELLSLNKAYTLSINFSGNLNSLVGAYMSSYTNDEGEEL